MSRHIRPGWRWWAAGAAVVLAVTVPSAQAGAATARTQHPYHAVAVQAAKRTITFVHGINGNYRSFQCKNLTGSTYEAILKAVCASPAYTEESFAYYQDLGYAAPKGTTPPCPGMPAPDTNTENLYVDPDSINPDICDSKGALAYTGAALHDHLADLGTPDTVMANSMGGAIARGWLAIAQHNGAGDKSLAHADSVIFLQTVQAGSYVARAGEAIASTPVIGPIARIISHAIGFDVDRPGVLDVTPQSPWYVSVNPVGVPANLAYYNFYSNIVVNFQINLGFFKINAGSFNIGDTVVLPGNPNPTAMPKGGSAQFLPGDKQTANRHQYAMDATVNVNPIDLTIPPLLARDITRIINNPISHIRFGSNVGTIKVAGCAAGSPQITVADEILRVLQHPTAGCA
jgi:hypothetical protein